MTDLTKPIERALLTSLVGKTIGAVQLLSDGETVKIYDQAGNIIMSVNANKLFDGDGFHFELPKINERMIQYKVICYGINDVMLSNQNIINTPDKISEYVLGGMRSGVREYHVIFTDSKGQDRVALCTRYRLGMLGETDFTAELIAFLSL